MPLDLSGLSLAGLLGLFTAAAVLVWIAGTRMTHFVNAISEKTGLGKAFTGMLILGGITSLPEVAAVSTSAAIGNAPLAVNNLLGAASVNLVLLAVADVIYGRDALTRVAASPATVLQGVLSMLLAALVAIFAAAGDIALFGVGAGSALLLTASAAALWLASRFDKHHVWEVVDEEEEEEAGLGEIEQIIGDEHEWPLGKLVFGTVIAAAVILAAGFLLAITADAVAGETGIAAGMVGFILVAFSTTLPEISSITAAVRLRQYEMAVGDIFGTNLFNISLIFLADLIYAGDPLLSVVGTFEIVGALLAILLTGIFLVGLLRRRPTAILRMGYDSLAVFIVFAAGVTALAGIASRTMPGMQ